MANEDRCSACGGRWHNAGYLHASGCSRLAASSPTASIQLTLPVPVPASLSDAEAALIRVDTLRMHWRQLDSFALMSAGQVTAELGAALYPDGVPGELPPYDPTSPDD